MLRDPRARRGIVRVETQCNDPTGEPLHHPLSHHASSLRLGNVRVSTAL